MKLFVITFLTAAVFWYSCDAATSLVQGDIAIIGYNFTDPDEFSFVTFKDLSEGTVLFFTDCGWKEDHQFRTGEGLITYTVPREGKKAFDVITYPYDPGFIQEGIAGFFGFSMDGDQIIAFQDSFTDPRFIYALTTGDTWNATASDNNTSALPSGLTDGKTALAIGRHKDALYNCALEDTRDPETILGAIAINEQWTYSQQRVSLPSSCFKTVLSEALLSLEWIKEAGKIRAAINTAIDEPLQLMLEESNDGMSFHTAVTLPLTTPGKQVLFDYSFKKRYYRIKAIVLNNGKILLSSIGVPPSWNLGQELFMAEIYDMSGHLLFSSGRWITEEEVPWLDIPGRPVLLLKISQEGAIDVKKRFFDYRE